MMDRESLGVIESHRELTGVAESHRHRITCNLASLGITWKELGSANHLGPVAFRLLRIEPEQIRLGEQKYEAGAWNW